MGENVNLPFGTSLPNAASLNGSGQPTQGEGYLPSGANQSAKKRFTSYDRSDTTKLDYAVNRHYSAAQGRFTQVDPIGMSAASLGDPQSLNLYAYCGNDPINQLDPSGLFSLKSIFGFIGKVLRFTFKVITAILVALTVLLVLLGTPLAVILLPLAAIFGIAGWHNGKLGKVVRLGISIGKNDYGGFRTPPISGSGGIGSISSFLPVQAHPSNLPQYYAQARAAAIFALQLINSSSVGLNAEFAGSICRDPVSGNVFAVPPNIGGAADAEVASCPRGTTRIGIYHSHAGPTSPNSDEFFSGELPTHRRRTDIMTADGLGVPSFLATPRGQLRAYIPNSAINPGTGVTGGRFLTFKDKAAIK